MLLAVLVMILPFALSVSVNVRCLINFAGRRVNLFLEFFWRWGIALALKEISLLCSLCRLMRFGLDGMLLTVFFDGAEELQ